MVREGIISPMLAQKKFREIILQLLFSIDMGEGKQEEILPLLMRELSVSKKIVTQAFERATSIWEKRQSLDQKIGELSQTYDFTRIGRVEQNVLRLGVYELEAQEIDHEVAIAEAIRLARKFASPEAASFVNAILHHAAFPV